MKTSFMLPSATYNIILSPEEAQQLLDRGIVTMHVSRVPCATGRAVWFESEGKIKTLDRKNVFNALQFCLDDSVADIPANDWHVQFVNICIEKENQNDQA